MTARKMIPISEAIRVLSQLEEPIVPEPKAAPPKSGWQTTEFWATVLVSVGATAAAATSNLPPRYAALASAVSVSAYALSRALAKF